MTTLDAAASIARALPCPATYGALYGLCERLALEAFPARGATYLAAVEVLYVSALEGWRRGVATEIAARIGESRELVSIAKYRLKQAGMTYGTSKPGH